jgi:putative flippase GtrA
VGAPQFLDSASDARRGTLCWPAERAGRKLNVPAHRHGLEMELPPSCSPWRDAAMTKLQLPTPETRLRVLRFILVGGGTALLQVAIIAVLKRFMNETLAFSISWIVSMATHYIANRFWALPSARHDTGKQFGEYLFTVAVSYGMNLFAFKVCREVIGLGVEWATLWAIPPSTVVVFLLLNYRVFRAAPKSG